MSQHVIETVTFKLNPEVDQSAFIQAANGMTTWIEKQPGFICRRLSLAEDGTWFEHIEWSDMDAARQAAATIGTEPSNADFLKAIDGASAQMTHSRLEVSVN